LHLLLEAGLVLSPLFLLLEKRGEPVSGIPTLKASRAVRSGMGASGTAASRLAGDSSLGSESMEITLMRMVSTV